MTRLTLLLTALLIWTGCGGPSDPDEPLDRELGNLVGYWGGYLQETHFHPEYPTEVIFRPVVLHVREEFDGVRWYGESLGPFDTNFGVGHVALEEGGLKLQAAENHPPLYLDLGTVTGRELRFDQEDHHDPWSLRRQAGCAIPFSFVGHWEEVSRPIFLEDGTFVFLWGRDREPRVIRDGHCVDRPAAIPPGYAWAAGPDGELWTVDLDQTADFKTRILLYRISGLTSGEAEQQTEIVAETDKVGLNDSYTIADDGTGRPVIRSGDLMWRKSEAGWEQTEAPRLEHHAVTRWRDGTFKQLTAPEHPEFGRARELALSTSDVVWGAFIESTTDRSDNFGTIHLGRLSEGNWQTWPVGLGGVMGLRVRSDGTVDIPVFESIVYHNLGLIEVEIDGDDVQTRYRRNRARRDKSPVGFRNEALAYGPGGAIFWGTRIRRPAAERGQRHRPFTAKLTLGEGVSAVRIPALDVRCTQDCQFSFPDNEGLEVRLTADGPAELTAEHTNLTRLEALTDSRFVLMVGGAELRAPLTLPMSATLK